MPAFKTTSIRQTMTRNQIKGNIPRRRKEEKRRREMMMWWLVSMQDDDVDECRFKVASPPHDGKKKIPPNLPMQQLCM
jgi:hypothetical protein